MSRPSEAPAPREPDIDANGVDRAQIREMLALTPLERLERVEQFVADALEILSLNKDLAALLALRAALDEAGGSEDDPR